MSYYALMQNEKEEIKRWLKKTGRDRNWLADQCRVGKRAVDKWLSTAREIPAAKLALIEKLMEESDDKSTALSIPPVLLPDLDERGKMFLNPTEESQKAIYTEAARLNMTPSTYCTLAAEWCCEQPNIGELLLRRLNAQKQSSDTPPPSQPSRQNDPTLIRGLDSAEETSA